MKINFRYMTDNYTELLGDVDMEVNIDDASYEDVERMFHRFMAAIGWSKRLSLREALEEAGPGWDIELLTDPPQEGNLFDD
jgi:hypothetical protein